MIYTLLGLGVLGFVWTSVALLTTRDVYKQIQYTYVSSIVGATGISLAVLIHEGFTQTGLKAVLIGAIVFWTSPLLAHATAKATRVRRHGQVMPTEQEQIPFVPEAKT